MSQPEPISLQSTAQSPQVQTNSMEAYSMEALIYKWELKEVQYKDGRKHFVPERYGGFTLHADGGIAWSDGCNFLFTSYTIEGQTIRIGAPASTMRGCPFEIEDVHYEQATHYELQGQTLLLHTPSQVYVLERFPYSRLSLNPWSLYSITDRRTGEVFNVGRFRTEYSQLFLSIESDESFRFIDLDWEEFTGSLQIEGNAILTMGYDRASRERLREKPEQQDYLPDNTQGYRHTIEQYPTTYAHKIDWDALESFRVFEGTLRDSALNENVETTFLEFYSDTQIYKFISR